MHTLIKDGLVYQLCINNELLTNHYTVWYSRTKFNKNQRITYYIFIMVEMVLYLIIFFNK